MGRNERVWVGAGRGDVLVLVVLRQWLCGRLASHPRTGLVLASRLCCRLCKGRTCRQGRDQSKVSRLSLAEAGRRQASRWARAAWPMGGSQSSGRLGLWRRGNQRAARRLWLGIRLIPCLPPASCLLPRTANSNQQTAISNHRAVITAFSLSYARTIHSHWLLSRSPSPSVALACSRVGPLACQLRETTRTNIVHLSGTQVLTAANPATPNSKEQNSSRQTKA